MMTPEQIEEKKRLHKHKHPDCAALITVGEFNWLLAALEESQQQLDEMTVNAVGWKEQYIAEWAKRSMLERELAEAQQTIARQREALTLIADMKVVGSSYVSMQAIARGELIRERQEGEARDV